jgi:selenocysteine lyase/cysteine desulfurase
VGALYVSPRALDELQPLTAGWRGVAVDAHGAPAGFAKGARRFEMATTSFAAHRGLLQALRTADSFAPAAERCGRVAALAERAFHALRAAGVRTLLDAPTGTSLVCFRPERAQPAQVVEALLRERIFVRHLQQTRVVRLSLSYLNTEDEVDAIAAAVRRLREAGAL